MKGSGELNKPVIIGLGEILWDMLPGGKKLGGAPANFAYHCSQLGADSYVISSVGMDDAGREILENLKRLQLSDEYIEIQAIYPTSTVTVKLDAGGHPEYTIHEQVAWDNMTVKHASIRLAQRADAICFGSLAQRSHVSCKTIHIYLAALPYKCLKVFDLNLRQNYYTKEIIENSLKISNVLKINDEEFIVLAEMLSLKGNEPEQAEALLRTYDLKLLALTRGGEGSSLITRSGRSDCKALAVNMIDSVGAGDSFTAALVTGLLKGVSLNELNQLASELAAYVCTQKGATPDIPAYLNKKLTYIQ